MGNSEGAVLTPTEIYFKEPAAFFSKTVAAYAGKKTTRTGPCQ